MIAPIMVYSYLVNEFTFDFGEPEFYLIQP
jgi:hypothetical protein